MYAACLCGNSLSFDGGTWERKARQHSKYRQGFAEACVAVSERGAVTEAFVVVFQPPGCSLNAFAKTPLPGFRVTMKVCVGPCSSAAQSLSCLECVVTHRGYLSFRSRLALESISCAITMTGVGLMYIGWVVSIDGHLSPPFFFGSEGVVLGFMYREQVAARVPVAQPRYLRHPRNRFSNLALVTAPRYFCARLHITVQ